jgi:hypothetical protein
VNKKTFVNPRAKQMWELVEAIADGPEDSTHVFNPWVNWSNEDKHPRALAPLQRRHNLFCHFCAPEVKLLMIGEAPGYRGCRMSGVAFSSERLIIDGMVPRVALPDRLSNAPRPMSESSATQVWAELHKHGLAEETILWNAFPWHPHKPEDGKSNRAPTARELRDGLGVLEKVIDAFKGAAVVTIGVHARKMLEALNVTPAASIRHPSMGGSIEFRDGMNWLANSYLRKARGVKFKV